MRSTRSSIATICIALLWLAGAAFADEAPITGSVTSVDATNRTLTVESAAKGQTRTVVIEVKPETKIVRFVRRADGGFSEQAAKLEDLKAGWIVAVKTHHHGDREVAETVRVVYEK